MPIVEDKIHNYVDELLEPLRKSIYRSVVPLDIMGWVTDEPVPFARRKEGAPRAFKVGDVWGSKLFDCAWFQFSGALPKDVDGTLVVRIDVNGEICIFDHTGCPIRGLTNKSSTFEPTLGAPGKRVYQIPTEALSEGWLELWADAGFNDLFGVVRNEGRIVLAEMAVCHENIRALYYDVEVLVDWLETLEPGCRLAEEIRTALDYVCMSVADGICDEAAVLLRESVAALFIRNERRALNISAIGHAHLDLAWLWPVRETIRKGARTLATVLYNIERYPEYIFGVSQPQLLEWMRDHYPALYDKIRKEVRSGRIELQGAMWVEPDCNITGGESLVRQILVGQRFFKTEFGHEVHNLWLPDTFGYNGQIPQIMRKSGIKYFMTQKLSWNTINRFPYHSFQWKGIDGSAVLAHLLPEETYSSPASPRSLKKVAERYAQKDVSGHALLAFGIGDGGGGPGAEHLERIKRIKKLQGLPGVQLRTAEDFFRRWEADAARFPVWEGELYLEKHQGTMTTQGLTKWFNRKCEIALRELEWISVLSEQFADIPYPTEVLDVIWKEVLLYQFHDILPGSSIARVYDETNMCYRRLLAQIEALAEERFSAIAAQCCAPGVALLAFNALSWPRSEWIKHHGSWFKADVPSMGYGVARKIESNHFPGVNVDEGMIENECLRICFAEDGTISSIYDKLGQREVTAGKCNRFMVYKDFGDAWDFPADYRDHPVGPMKLVSGETYLDGPVAGMAQTYHFGEASRLNQKISLQSGKSLIEFETELNWQDVRKMLRVEFPIAVHARDATYEIQYGSIRRPTHDDTSWDLAKNEVAAQQWADLSHHDYGVSLINDAKYGHRIKGNQMELTLLRSIPHPSAARIFADDVESDSGSAMTDIGLHRFRYALYPHCGDHVGAGTLQEARIFNQPLRLLHSADNVPAIYEDSFLSLDHEQIDVTAVKKAENGKGWIVRLCCMMDQPCSTKLRIRLQASRVCETSLMEVDGNPLMLSEDGTVELAFSPFEIRTLRFY